MRNFTDLNEEGDAMTSLCQSLQEISVKNPKNKGGGCILPVCVQQLNKFRVGGCAAAQSREYEVEVRVGGAWG